MAKRRPDRERSVYQTLIGSHSLVGQAGVLLIALSFADLFVTYRLLWHGEHFYESNPLARWFFERWNVAGLIGFKFGLIGFVLVLGEVIERNRPGAGRAVVLVGCVGAAAVVVHGLRLLLGAAPD